MKVSKLAAAKYEHAMRMKLAQSDQKRNAQPCCYNTAINQIQIKGLLFVRAKRGNILGSRGVRCQHCWTTAQQDPISTQHPNGA